MAARRRGRAGALGDRWIAHCLFSVPSAEEDAWQTVLKIFVTL